jgi:hypothetical protein
MRIVDKIQIRSNLVITAYERGKIVGRREGHNIWLDIGRTFILQLISFQSFGPDVPVRDDRIKYMGVGIGGTAQKQLAQANSSPISPPYTGSNAQDDETPTVTFLERPVRISGSASNYPGLAGDQWIGKIQAPPDFSEENAVTFRRVFVKNEVSYAPFLSVPLSEVGLFTSAANPENYRNAPVAYDTYDTLSKTSATAFQYVWTIRV